jgi:hypothetical protein
LERKYSKTLREENGRNGIMERERERENGKSSSITIAQDMVSWGEEKRSIYT